MTEPAPGDVTFTTDLTDVDWDQLKEDLVDDGFDNGRTAEQLRRSFEASVACLAFRDGRVVGKVRALTDGVCNAYVVDTWTHSSLRRQGVGSHLMSILLEQLPGQHVYLFSETAVGFFETLGFAPQPTGLSRVVGTWLDPASRGSASGNTRAET